MHTMVIKDYYVNLYCVNKYNDFPILTPFSV